MFAKLIVAVILGKSIATKIESNQLVNAVSLQQGQVETAIGSIVALSLGSIVLADVPLMEAGIDSLAASELV